MDHLRVSTFGNDTGNVSKRDLRRSGALAMILGGLFPPIGAFFTTLPDCVLGGGTKPCRFVKHIGQRTH